MTSMSKGLAIAVGAMLMGAGWAINVLVAEWIIRRGTVPATVRGGVPAT